MGVAAQRIDIFAISLYGFVVCLKRQAKVFVAL
jgi:hypothetical protein